MPSSPLPPDRIGRYVIERKIGEGGMGIVYAARDERLDRTVALKTIRGASDESARRRLWREARAAAGVSHPNICQLYEVDETDEGLVLAMELLDGSFGADATLLTEAGVIVGTPNYMAPEQVRGETLDARADLFSMAALLF